MVKTRGLHLYTDEHNTDPEVARRIVRHFDPRGHVLEPFLGGGAFWDALLEGSTWNRILARSHHPKRKTFWCELAKGNDFFEWTEPVDWIVTNPPYSNLTEVMKKCFEVASRTVLLVPMSKIYSSAPRMDLVKRVAGIEEQYVLGVGRDIGFNTGFPFAAMKFTRGYHGPTRTIWREG